MQQLKPSPSTSLQNGAATFVQLVVETTPSAQRRGKFAERDRQMFAKILDRSLYLALAVLALFGGVLIAASHAVTAAGWPIFAEIMKELGAALIIACVLGATVDRTLKTQFAKDVFLAAFAYVLPSELKAEIARIIGYRFLCTEHHTIIEITEVGDGLVRVEMSAERVIKNISSQPQSLEGRFAIDEWGFSGRCSHIEQCTLELGAERLVGRKNTDEDYKQGDAIAFITDPRNIKSGETARIIVRGHEFQETMECY